MKKIFISYSHQDKDSVNLLVQQLKLHGLPLWRDWDDLPFGKPTQAEIRETLSKTCQGCLIYLTPNSLQSDFVMKVELKEAMERLSVDKKFALIPIFHGITIAQAQTSVPTYSGRSVTELNGLTIPAGATDDEVRDEFAEAAHRLLQNLLATSRPEFTSDPTRKLILDINTRQYSYRTPEPDLDLDWRSFILNDDTIDATLCSQRLLPALLAVEKSAAKALGFRPLLCRPSAHLSCGVALGFAFRATTSFQLEIEQPIPGKSTQLWSTTNLLPANSPLQVDKSEGDISSDEAAVELSVARLVTSAVDHWVNQRKRHGHDLRVRVAIKPAGDALKYDLADSATANAVALQVADEIAKLQSDYQPRVTHLFVAAPLALAILLGYRLNARGAIQLYELKRPDQIYVPSFALM